MQFLKYILILILGGTFMVPSVFAEDALYGVRPLIVDEKVKQRDILKKTVTLTNNTERRLDIYASVHNVNSDTGEYVFQDSTEVDRAVSLANWIEITRGVIELDPGEVRQIPYLIQVNYNAVPGVYHAVVSFAYGSNRPEAEKKLPNVPNLTINVDVSDNANEQLQLGVFKPEKTFFSGSTASFSYLLENIGNRAVSPKGEIRIFNRKGEEVAVLDANNESAALLPDAVSELDAMWESEGGFGRYKALLELEYGERQRGTVYDTVFFWIIPWKKIMAIFITISVALVVLSYLVYGRYNRRSFALATEYSTSEEQFPVEQNQYDWDQKVEPEPGYQQESEPIYEEPVTVAPQMKSNHSGSGEQVVLATRQSRRTQEPVMVGRTQSRISAEQSVTISPRRRPSASDGGVVDLSGV